VKAGGQTRTTLAQEIAQKLRDEKILIDPNVTVNVLEYNSRVVYITGQGIAKPGAYPLIGSLKVSELIAKAGGLKEWAKAKEIKIVRGKQAFSYNDDQVNKAKYLDQDIELQPGDHVNIP
jgi:protein involved in polysaccharide export with SLBB domain